MHRLEEFSFSQYKKATAKKSPHILKCKDTFFSATSRLCVFEAALFLPFLEHYSSFPERILQCLLQLTCSFLRSDRQLRLRWWEALTLTFTPGNHLASKAASELNQMTLILKASKITL